MLIQRYPAAFRLGLAILAASVIAVAQGPVGETVVVKLDRPTYVGSQMLPPGDYTIRQITSTSNPRVLEFTSDNGTKLDATVMAIPAMQNTPPLETKVILNDEGGTPRITRIWVQGETYGYEFPAEDITQPPAAPKPIGLQGRFSSARAVEPVPAAKAAPAPAAPPPQQTAQAVPPPPPPPQAQPAPPQEIAQAAPPPPPPQQPPAEQSTPNVPATALGWVDLVVAGFSIAAGGFVLSRCVS